MSRVGDLLKSAVELNLRYSSTLLYLSKDYLKEVNAVLTREPTSPAAPSPPAGDPAVPPPPPQRAPLLVVGRPGETANAAFAVNNPGEKAMNVHLLVQGEFDERRVTVDPPRLAMPPGASAVVRILARIDDTLVVDRDYVGSVVAPGLSGQSVPFVVRRLPDAGSAPADEPSAAAAAPSSETAATDGPAGGQATPRRAARRRGG